MIGANKFQQFKSFIINFYNTTSIDRSNEIKFFESFIQTKSENLCWEI